MGCSKKKNGLLTLHGVREGNRRKGNNANGGGDAREGVGAREIYNVRLHAGMGKG